MFKNDDNSVPETLNKTKIKRIKRIKISKLYLIYQSLALILVLNPNRETNSRAKQRNSYQFSSFLLITFLFDSVCIDVWIQSRLVNDSQHFTEIDLFTWSAGGVFKTVWILLIFFDVLGWQKRIFLVAFVW